MLVNHFYIHKPGVGVGGGVVVVTFSHQPDLALFAVCILRKFLAKRYSVAVD